MRITLRIVLFPLLTVMLAASCAVLPREESREPRMRYLSLSALFDYLARNDGEAGAVKARKESLRGKIDDLEGKLRSGSGAIPEAVLKSDLRKYQGELRDVSVSEDRLRGKYYQTINIAVTAVARRLRIDYVFNIGDGLVYSPRENDITELVIQELSGMKDRGAPQSR